jgi:hypothetical protein
VTSRSSVQSGFTFTDLLVGAVITTTVISVAGVGLATMIDANKLSNAKSERRVEMNRSLDFISNEIRSATEIPSNLSTAVPAAFNPPATQVDTSSVTKVLAIENGWSDPIVYYSATPVSGKWAGPKAIYRWGPKFNSDGSYSSTDSTSWTYEALVDKIDTSVPMDSCHSGWTRNGSAGFYACVDSTQNIAQIYQTGQIKKTLGRTEPYAMAIQTGTRDTVVASNAYVVPAGVLTASLPTSSSTGSGSGTPSPSPSPSPVAPPPTPFVKSGGNITAPNTSTISIVNLGSQFPCPTWGKIYLTGGTNNGTAGELFPPAPPKTNPPTRWGTSNTLTKTIAANTSLRMVGRSGSQPNGSGCYSVNYLSDSVTKQGTLVNTLVNGQKAPTKAGAGSQASLQQVLGVAGLNPLTSTPILDSNGYVRLASNQVIYLFEQWTTTTSSPNYDFQDIVLLVTITPNSTTQTSYPAP